MRLKKNAQDRRSFPKPLNCSFLNSKKVYIFRISELEVDFINSKKWSHWTQMMFFPSKNYNYEAIEICECDEGIFKQSHPS